LTSGNERIPQGVPSQTEDELLILALQIVETFRRTDERISATVMRCINAAMTAKFLLLLHSRGYLFAGGSPSSTIRPA